MKKVSYILILIFLCIFTIPVAQAVTPTSDRFGIFTERADITDRLTTGVMNIWRGLAPIVGEPPFEGTAVLAFRSPAGLTGWCGGGINAGGGPFFLPHYATGFLNFAIRIPAGSTETFRLRVENQIAGGANGGSLHFVPGSDPAGVLRDGNWHFVSIPVSHFTTAPGTLRLNDPANPIGNVFAMVSENPTAGFIFDDIFFSTTVIPVTGITVASPADTLTVAGGTMQMTASLVPANANNPIVRWSVDAPGVATISPTGLLTAVANGTVVVTGRSAANSDVVATKTVTVALSPVFVPVTGITVTSPADTLSVTGGAMQMTATVAPANATSPAITWSVNNPAIATISASGLLIAVANGTVVVTATSVSEPTVSGTKTIIVRNQRQAPTADRFGIFTERADITERLEDLAIQRWDGHLTDIPAPARPAPFEGTEVIALQATNIWSGFGLNSPRNVNLQHYAGGFLNFAIQIPVGHANAFRIRMENHPDGGTFGGALWFRVGEDPHGVLRDGNWHFVSVPMSHFTTAPNTLNIANPIGNIFAGITNDANGRFIIDDVFFSTTVIPVTVITVASPADTIKVAGGTMQMTASLVPANANNPIVRWSVDAPGVATISPSGLLTAVANGTVVVRGTSAANNTVLATKTIIVAIPAPIVPVSGITVTSPADTILVAGGTLQMAATVAPANATNPAVTWSVNRPAIATISATGLLTAVSNGTVVVTATSVSNPAVSGTKTIIVANQSAILFYDFEGDTINQVLPFETGWAPGDITVTVVDDPLNPGTGNNVMRTTTTNWNAGPALMFVLPAGRNLAEYSQLRFRGHFATGDVGWKNIRVIAYTAVPGGPFDQSGQRGVTIGSYNRARAASTAWEDIRINIAGSDTLTGTIYLAFGFNNSGSTWFADDVQLVFNVPVTDMTLTAPNDSILVDDGTMQMVATASPANATIPAVTWSVNTPAVATISATGLLTAINNGTVTVTATSVANPTIIRTMDIAVVNQRIQITGITVTSPAATITVAGGTLQMAATVLPANAENPAVTWSVNADTVATISATGLLTAVANGTVVVRATSVSDTTVSGTRTITVAIAPPVGVPILGTATIALYPVPVDLQLNIESSVAIERVEVLSIVGRTLISEAFVGNRAAVDMSALPAGTYLVRVTKANGDIVVRTIIKN